ncbi:hypothetical protein K469DRAFT_546677 [Zopfia rhizophila CBS 207.26]|uniref:Uncharacterized protein n=1 Tax=Zopfia rhizophila CBS 207.26 TaxID=1314779 RepID=A0A6A6EVD5_9PEZI|nr:hypothetical protein K469DRAFT_546677 [Zopfia rhizophila CBS 207.26]
MTAPGVSNLTAILQGASIGSASIVRCPATMLNRFRSLNPAEYIILFTPVVPHPLSTELDLNMDPFEPLGRSLSRRHSRIRHVPYVPSKGMTQTHIDFLRTAGAVVVVVCTTQNIATQNTHRYNEQTGFARDISHRVEQDESLASVPLLLVLITDGLNMQPHYDGVHDFPALITHSNYTPTALEGVAREIFGA